MKLYGNLSQCIAHCAAAAAAEGKSRWTVTNLINDKPSLTADDCDSNVCTSSTLSGVDTSVSVSVSVDMKIRHTHA